MRVASCIILISILSFPSLAQDTWADFYGKIDDQVTKEKGRYTPVLGYDARNSTKEKLRCGGNRETRCGLVKSALLYLQWWTLFDQSVEFVSIEWEIGDEVRWTDPNSGETLTVRRADLEPFPDLVKSWNDLRPMRMRFSAPVVLDAGMLPYEDYVKYPNFLSQQNIFAGDIRTLKGRKDRKNVPNLKARFRKIITPNHMIVGSAGQKSSDLLPISP